LCLFLLIFVGKVYAVLPYKIGGGRAPRVSIELKTSTTPIMITLTRGRLLDESDHGFYILPDGSNSALFLPRERVESIVFSPR
jgi:hypothetical protein